MAELQKPKKKLHGREFWKSIGSPNVIIAPMVEQSEFAWRMLTRSFMTPETNKDLLAYTPMFHARLFIDAPKYRADHFQPIISTLASPPDTYHTSQIPEEDLYLDGKKNLDRPLFVQFCANVPEELLAAAKIVQPFCDAVDLNLGCPQGIAKKGNYGAFLQEDQELIYKLINTLHNGLDIPVTAKMRVLDNRENTLAYAKTILSAGASILTVHGRERHQKGHNTGVADWTMLRYLRDNLPPDAVLFANGNILQHDDIQQCFDETGFDGVMSAEGNLHDPSIFGKPPPVGEEGREYWRGKDGKGGYRMDAVLRRYMDIIYRHVLNQEPPQRKPLFLPSDPPEESPKDAQKENKDAQEENTDAQKDSAVAPEEKKDEEDGLQPTKTQKRQRPEEETEDVKGEIPLTKKQKRQQNKAKPERCSSPNLTSMQSHLFQMLRPLISKHVHVRDALARVRAGNMAAFENVLALIEEVVKQGLIDYERDGDVDTRTEEEIAKEIESKEPESLATIARCKRPWFICQPWIRPLPKEAFAKGALKISKKELARMEKEKEEAREAGVTPGGRVEQVKAQEGEAKVEDIPKEGMVCG